MRYFALLAAALLAVGGCADAPAIQLPKSIADLPLAGGTDVTFLVTSDTHFGGQGFVGRRVDGERATVPIEQLLATQVEQINAIVGRPWPGEIGGTVDEPAGVLVAGDLTEDGKSAEWDAFRRQFLGEGPDGGGVRWPVYETVGNHDRHGLRRHVDRGVRKRHGDVRYVLDWGDLRLIGLDEAPRADNLRWLAKRLAEAGRQRPIILWWHIALTGPYADRGWEGWGNKQDRLAELIDGFNVIAIFHGHWHHSQAYRWRGYDAFNVGSAKHGRNSFAVVRVTDERLDVASWDWTNRRWGWWVSREIN